MDEGRLNTDIVFQGLEIPGQYLHWNYQKKRDERQLFKQMLLEKTYLIHYETIW